MPFYVALLMESMVVCTVSINMRKSNVNAINLIGIVILLFAAGVLVFSRGMGFGITAIIINSLHIIILTLVTVITIKNLSLALVLAIVTMIIVLLSAHLASFVLNLAYFLFPNFIQLGRDGVLASVAMSIIYFAVTFTIAFSISHLLGNALHTKIKGFDAKLQKKLALYMLWGAILTLFMFFISAFLRDILDEANMLTLAYALSLGGIFIYLVFAMFAFAENHAKGIELNHKTELLNNLETYTENVEKLATEMRKFRHDHKNLMLGFNGHMESKDWNGLIKYYQKYMGEFVTSSDVLDACSDKLGNIQTSELKALLIGKFSLANTVGIKTIIDIESKLAIKSGYNLLDTCRIVGIFMDNAIEACKNVEGSTLQFMGTMINDNLYLVFQNTCIQEPKMNQIGKKGFTTKEGARGMGLYNVSKIISKNPRLTLKTSFKNNKFAQELTITPGE